MYGLYVSLLLLNWTKKKPVSSPADCRLKKKGLEPFPAGFLQLISGTYSQYLLENH